MSRVNTLWGAPRIHGELLKYMVRHPKPPSQTVWTFHDNHVGCLDPINFLVVPMATFAVLLIFIVLRHEPQRDKPVAVHPRHQKRDDRPTFDAQLGERRRGFPRIVHRFQCDAVVVGWHRQRFRLFWK